MLCLPKSKLLLIFLLAKRGYFFSQERILFLIFLLAKRGYCSSGQKPAAGSRLLQKGNKRLTRRLPLQNQIFILLSRLYGNSLMSKCVHPRHHSLLDNGNKDIQEHGYALTCENCCTGLHKLRPCCVCICILIPYLQSLSPCTMARLEFRILPKMITLAPIFSIHNYFR